MVTLDFETEAIEGNPIVNPPKPVGLAIRWHEGNAEYITNLEIVENLLKELWDSDRELLFHNAPFDLAVARAHFGLPWPDWHRVHDTMPLLFIDDPYAASLSLKPSAERLLGEFPDEQNALHAWILANVPGATAKNAGAHISKAPVALVAPYAIGDVERTFKLYALLRPRVPTQPYDVERRLAPILSESSIRGVRVDRDALHFDTQIAVAAQDLISSVLRQRLGDINFNSPKQLGEKLESLGFVLPRTEKGNISTARDALELAVTDKSLLDLLAYHSTLETLVGTFMLPWLELSERTGRLHPEWNSVRGDKNGTRTGRLSCNNPNLQNIPNILARTVPDGLSALPHMRDYLLPEEGCVWAKRDYSSQEVRILAHFEEGALADAYRANPSLDPHSLAQEMIKKVTGVEYPRKDVKITAFSVIYGAGASSLAEQLKRSRKEAQEIKSAYLAAFPGVLELQRSVTSRLKMGGKVKTLGGRLYGSDHPIMKCGRVMTFEYKGLNALIQGSAADQTKQSVIDWHENSRDGVSLLATVHDEINVSIPKEYLEDEMAHLKHHMNADRLDVPMLSEGFVGPSWGQVEPCE